MNRNLRPPFDNFRLEKSAGEYKDFQLSDDDPYPLKGVTYPVDYGDIPNYIGEDGADLDVFLGSGTIHGFMKVNRPELPNGETKFLVNVTEDEATAIFKAFESVLASNGLFDSYDDLLGAIKRFEKHI